MPIYNKLVRDKILEIIAEGGTKYNSRILEPHELLTEVKAKMIEEAKEFHDAETVQDNIEELADILELVHTALNVMDVTYEELDLIRKHKKDKRGGFEKGIYLIDVEDK